MRRLLLLSLLITLACTTSPGGAPLQDRDWTLTGVEGVSSLSAGPAPTLRFGSDGRVSGNSGCNMAGADYTVAGDRLNIAALMMTKRACAEQSRNELEAAFVGAVQRARSFRIADGTLDLLDDSGHVVARFR